MSGSIRRPEETCRSISQDNGKIQGTYEELITGLYTITATSVSNSTVTISQTVQFYNATATSHNVLANPQTMPSRDVKADIYSNISAKVVDEVGNGVPGETVTFTLSGITYSPSTVGNTSQPSFSQTSTITTITATTGLDGIATAAILSRCIRHIRSNIFPDQPPEMAR